MNFANSMEIDQRARMALKNLAVLVLIHVLSGCATPTQSAKLQKIDERIFRVSVHAFSFRNREIEAFSRAQKEASEQCAREWMQPQVLKMEAGIAASLPVDTVVLTFRCLSEWDPEYYRPAPVLLPLDRG